MGELVPQRAAPIESIGLSCGRRVHYKKLSETDTECTDAGQAQRPDGKIGVVRVHFKCDRTFRFEAIFRGKRFVSLLQKLLDVRAQDGDFFFVQLDLEMRRIEADEVLEAVQQREGVVCPLV